MLHLHHTPAEAAKRALMASYSFGMSPVRPLPPLVAKLSWVRPCVEGEALGKRSAQDSQREPESGGRREAPLDYPPWGV